MTPKITWRWFNIGGAAGYFVLHPLVMIISYFMSEPNLGHAFSHIIVSEILMSFSIKMLPWSFAFGIFGALTGFYYGRTRQVEKALRESEERFRKMAATAQDALIMIDSQGNVLYWNKASEKIFGYAKKDVVGKKLLEFVVPRRYYEAYQNEIRSFKLTGQSAAIGKTLETSALKKDRTEFPVDLSLSSVEIKGEWHALGIIRDISERKRLEEQLWRLSYLDELTSVANRRYFEKKLEEEWNRAARDDRPLSLIMCDVDFFKAFNDACGHQSGDDCLKKVAGALREVLKRPGDLVARYGGEEFVIVLPNSNANNAAFVVEALRQKVKTLGIEHPSSPVCNLVTISFGIAVVIPCSDSAPAHLIYAADRALYEAKKGGRNRVKIYDLIEDDENAKRFLHP